jgi:transcription-repair coupling factor (superfamily II helicase)
LSKTALYNTYDNSPKTAQIVARLQENNQVKMHLEGLLGSSLSFVIRSVFKKAELPFLIVLNNKEEAAYYLNDLEQMIGDQDVLFYPGSFRRPYHPETSGEETDNANVLLRAEVLNRINSRKNRRLLLPIPKRFLRKL